MSKPVCFSGVQPSGNPTLGNYIGAFRPFTAYQNSHNAYFCVVDHHAITVRQDPKELRENSFAVAAWYIASGLNPADCTLFIQSHVPAHVELGWILNTFAQIGELERMTQYKDKAARYMDNVNVGLFGYPVLMAADILLYNTDEVPVGDDQIQHIELCRDIATRFNENTLRKSSHFISQSKEIMNDHLARLRKDLKRKGKSDEFIWEMLEQERNFASSLKDKLDDLDHLDGWNYHDSVFNIPKAVTPIAGARVKDLREPTRKMSKSLPGAGCILLSDSPDVAFKKIKSAVTDTENYIAYDPINKPGVSNLIEILGACMNRSPQMIAEELDGYQYGFLKNLVADAVVSMLRPLQSEYNHLMDDKFELTMILRRGAVKANETASATLKRVKDSLGYVTF
ncbi:MAG: tryptophan--tRNA ligase [Alphaproteobacteria bacterium]|nr:MAG: tryptophan--tRNA ligase [Alphaproteobacteria bacterium]